MNDNQPTTLAATQIFFDGKVELRPGDCRDVIRAMPDASIDSVVCDPPYALVSIVKRFGGPNAAPANDGDVYSRASSGFMGKQWDTGETAFAATFWAEVLRVLKPGGHVVAFSGTRTYHRMAVAIEDAGFEIRDQIGWLYGAGFPKSHNVSRKLDGIRCACAGCETTASVLQYDVRLVRNADVSEAEHASEERGKILLASVQEQGSHGTIEGTESEQGIVAREERGVEGRSNAKTSKGKLRVGAVREMSASSALNVEAGRVHNGASQGDGGMGGPTVDSDGGGASRGPQAAKQSTFKLGTVAGQSQSQDGGAWPICAGCGKPIIPDSLGTALKPAWEPICLARKPLSVNDRPATVAANVLEHGTGALNIDGCRVATDDVIAPVYGGRKGEKHGSKYGHSDDYISSVSPLGRWPANIVHDGSEEVLAGFPDARSGGHVNESHSADGRDTALFGNAKSHAIPGVNTFNDSGSAARFFYTAKADKLDRIGSKHPTVKPVDLMQWLCRMVTPPGGLVLDPFAGSGSTGEAAWREGFRCILIEREEEYQADIAARLNLADKGPATRKARAIKQDAGFGPLFGDNDNANSASSGSGGGQSHIRQVRGPAAGI